PTQAAELLNSTVTCYNGGTCNNYTVSPACLCPLPYIAPYCESAADYCFTLQPDKNITELPVCQNGGTCTLTYTDPYFNCSCPTGYTEGYRPYRGTECKVTQLRVQGLLPLLLALLQLKISKTLS
uniref:EGF-like domain-containing protein n=1 Tax=Macrostomum lignano TaxID=282301 RepID=A0A1I8JH25_9PLAT